MEILMEDRREHLGRLGEELVAKVLNGTLSHEKYDGEKDMVLGDGTYVEVKTQVRWKIPNCFTIDETVTNNNINKCLNVDRLIFVEPGLNNEIRIFEAVDRKYSIKKPRGKKTYCFGIDDMKLIATVTNKGLCEEMISLSKTDRSWLI